VKKKSFKYFFPVDVLFGKLVMVRTPLAAIKINFRTETKKFKTDILQRLCLL